MYLLEQVTQMGVFLQTEKPPAKKGANAVQTNNTAACNGPGTSHRSQNTWVHEIFQGTLTNETLCLNCETVSFRPSSFKYNNYNI